MIVIAHNIRSLHNIGSIFRNAAAFGIEKLYLTGYTEVPPRKEIAKVALGAQDLVKWDKVEIDKLIAQLKNEGYEVWGLETGEGAILISELKSRILAPLDPPMTGGKRVRGAVGLVDCAKELRKNQTLAENILWNHLKSKKLEGYKFRRQHRIGRFVVDFYCDSARLIIELDGNIHHDSEVMASDEVRQQYLEDLGYQVIRFKNEDVIDDIDEVLKKILLVLPSSHGGVGGGQIQKIALVLGNEVEGIDQDTIDQLDGIVEIPMQKKKSLNVSVASGIAMYVLS